MKIGGKMTQKWKQENGFVIVLAMIALMAMSFFLLTGASKLEEWSYKNTSNLLVLLVGTKCNMRQRKVNLEILAVFIETFFIGLK